MKPILIGIAGPSGSGKTTAADAIAKQLDALVFHSDNYFQAELPTMISPDDGQAYPDWNHPASLRSQDLIRDIRQAAGAAEHSYIVAEGALLFYFEELRPLFDYKIFITARIETCLYRRIVRNVKLFGQSPEIIGQYYLRCARHREAEYCLPTIQYADYVIDNDIGCRDALNKLPFMQQNPIPFAG